MNMPKDPLLLALIPEGLNSELIQQLLEDGEMNRLSELIAILSARVSELRIDPEKSTDVRGLTDLANTIRKLIAEKASLELRKGQSVSTNDISLILMTVATTFYEVEDDPRKRELFLSKLRVKIKELIHLRTGQDIANLTAMEEPQETGLLNPP